MGLFGGKALADAARYGGGSNWADKIMLIGAALKDASSGGSDNMTNIMQLQVARQKMLAQQQMGQQAAKLFQSQLDPNAPSVQDMVTGQMAGDPNAPTAQQVGARIAPSTSAILPQLAQLQAQGLDVTPYVSMATHMKADKPQMIEGPDGIYRIGEDGKPTLALKYPDKPAQVSPGWIENPDGTWTPKKGGPYDPEYIAETTGIRRDAVVARPMPRSGGGRGGGSAKPKPWERKY